MSDTYPCHGLYGGVTLPPLAAPILSVVGESSTTVTLALTAVPNGCGFAIFMGATSGGENLLAPIAVTTDSTAQQVTIPNLIMGAEYFFVAKTLGCFGQGYGQPSNEVFALASSYPLYYGFVSTPTPNAAQIQALASQIVSGTSGTYNLTGGGGYPCIVTPAAFVTSQPFSIGGAPYGFQNNGTIPLTLDGLTFVFNIFVLPFYQNATSLLVTLP